MAKLAHITPDNAAHCYLCRWDFKLPFRKRVIQGKAEQVSPQERFKLLEDVVLAHLRDAHDRLLLTKEETRPEEGEAFGKVYYLGRR